MPFPFFCRLISLPQCQFQHNCSYRTDSLSKERPLVGLLRGASCSISSVFVSRKLPQLWPRQRNEQSSSLNKIYSNAFNPQMSWRFVCALKKKLSFDNILIVGMKFWAKTNSKWDWMWIWILILVRECFMLVDETSNIPRLPSIFSILKSIWIQSIVCYWFSAKAIQSLCSMNKILCKGGLFKFCTTESGYCISPTFFWLKKWNKFVPEWMRSGGQNWTHTHNKYKTVTTLT